MLSEHLDRDQLVTVAEGVRVEIRDSKDPDGPVLFFSQEAWSGFLDGAVLGEFGTR